ncbi:hypothetical protein HDU85_003997 [Gaertneriomyces sp. JEL0708]|nr:hypothetical protein HDU85_003997 [Gaertneriomyces sp. JEL0708]
MDERREEVKAVEEVEGVEDEEVGQSLGGDVVEGSLQSESNMSDTGVERSAEVLEAVDQTLIPPVEALAEDGESTFQSSNMMSVSDLPVDEWSTDATEQPSSLSDGTQSGEVTVLAPNEGEAHSVENLTEESLNLTDIPLLQPPGTTVSLTGLDTFDDDEENDDDDFGDFENFETAEVQDVVPNDDAFDGFAMPQNASVGPEEELAQPSVDVATLGDPSEEARISNLVNGLYDESKAMELLRNVEPVLARTYPVAAPDLPNTLCRPLQPLLEIHDDTLEGDVRCIQPNPYFRAEPWYEVCETMLGKSNDAHDTMGNFRWRKSAIRKEYLRALDIQVTEEEPKLISTPPISKESDLPSPQPLKLDAPSRLTLSPMAGSSGSERTPSKDSREAELLEARKLCDITEDDLRRKTTLDLNDLIHALKESHQKMQGQANFWLDSKEQLVLDAEMHHKMIASLVQYAQQQQGPKGGKLRVVRAKLFYSHPPVAGAAAPPKKGKKATGSRVNK